MEVDPRDLRELMVRFNERFQCDHVFLETLRFIRGVLVSHVPTEAPILEAWTRLTEMVDAVLPQPSD